MRRTALTIVATVVGLVLLLQFKTHPAGGSGGGLAALGSVPVTSSSPSPKISHRSITPRSPKPRTTAREPRTTARATPKATKVAAAPRSVTATGQTIATRYGPVQVRIVETGGRLTDVTALQLPSGNQHSSQIAARAVPILRSEALKANSARIDIVSGATYTSNGYAQSLQSALDKA